MKERRKRIRVWIWPSLLALLMAACTKTKIGPTATPTTKVVPTTARATATVVLTPTPTVSAVAATATLDVPPTDLCVDYLQLSVLYGEAKVEAVPTSYRCHGAYIDSTERSPGPPELVVRRGEPMRLQLAVERRPTAIDVRLYPGTGVAASFLRWPEELPMQAKVVDRSQPEPNTRFQYLAQAQPGPHSLNVKVTWGEEVEVFYAISVELEEPAAATHAPTPTLTPTPTPSPLSLTLDPDHAPDEVQLEVLEQIGGHSLAVAVEQGRVYLGLGPRLVALDPFSASAGLQRVGQSGVLPGVVQDVYLVDHLAYVALGEAGLVVVDVSDLSSMRLRGTASAQGDARAVFVDPEEGLAYVASGGAPGQAGMLSVVDVSQPDELEQVSSVPVPGVAYALALLEHYVYVVYEDGLSVIDVSDPAAPIEVVSEALPQCARDLAIGDGYAYVAGCGLQIIDVSEPAQPRQMGTLESRFAIDVVALQGKLAYLVETFCEMGHCGSTVYIRDLSDLSKSYEVSTWFTKSAVEDAVVYEDTLYLASWQRGLQAIDVSDPADPRLLGEYVTLAAVEDVAVSDGFGYVSDEAQSGLQVLDLGEASQLRVRGTAESMWAGGYAIVDGYAYVPVWEDGLRIVNVRNPDAPQEVATLDLEGTADRAVVVGERAYVASSFEGLVVLDVAVPAVPRILGTLPLDGLIEGLAVAGDYAYLTLDDAEPSKLYAIDVTDPSQPNVVGQVALAGKGRDVALSQNSDYVYVAVASCAYHQCSGGLQVVDLRDPRHPRIVLWVEVPGGVLDIAVGGEHAYLAARSGGVWVLDLADPASPREVGWKDTAGWARRIAVADDRVYVADGAGGLLVLQVNVRPDCCPIYGCE